MGDRQLKRSVCVTGAGGYIGSWLVKNLLHKGYTVHATLRDPGNQAKTGHLLSLPGAKESLKLFKADLSEEGSFDSAVTGCEGVFHVASPMDFSKDHEDDFIKPAVNGVVNVLSACTKAGTVKRLVYTSSVTAASPLINDTGEYSECLDESRWTDVDLMRNKKPAMWMYCIAKTLAEQAAIQLGNENQIEVLSIAPAIVGGPCLTPTLPFSTQVTLSPITGEGKYYEMLKSLRHVLGSIPLVHIDDVCNAHIFLMEKPTAQGRYICSSCSLDMNELVENFCKCYPESNVQFKFEDEDRIGGAATSSKKLLDMGFSYNYGLQEILDQSIKCAIMMRVLQ